MYFSSTCTKTKRIQSKRCKNIFECAVGINISTHTHSDENTHTDENKSYRAIDTAESEESTPTSDAVSEERSLPGWLILFVLVNLGFVTSVLALLHPNNVTMNVSTHVVTEVIPLEFSKLLARSCIHCHWAGRNCNCIITLGVTFCSFNVRWSKFFHPSLFHNQNDS